MLNVNANRRIIDLMVDEHQRVSQTHEILFWCCDGHSFTFWYVSTLHVAHVMVASIWLCSDCHLMHLGSFSWLCRCNDEITNILWWSDNLNDLKRSENTPKLIGLLIDWAINRVFENWSIVWSIDLKNLVPTNFLITVWVYQAHQFDSKMKPPC